MISIFSIANKNLESCILFLKQIKFFRLDPWRNKIIMVGRINGVYIGSLEHSGFRSEYVLCDLDYVENNCVDYRSSIYFFLFFKFLNFVWVIVWFDRSFDRKSTEVDWILGIPEINGTPSTPCFCPRELSPLGWFSGDAKLFKFLHSW